MSAILLVGLSTVFFGYHNLLKNGISDTGIAFWGNYYQWNAVKSYQWEDNDDKLFNTINLFSIFSYKDVDNT